MAQAENGNTVKVHYTGRFEDGTVFDSSSNTGPMQFVIGEARLIPGFEKAVVGMSPGESKSVSLSPEEAYGPHHEQMVQVIDRNQVPPNLTPEVGQQLEGRRPDGQTTIFMVTDVSDSSVTLDANHPLAGKVLIFDIELVEIF